MTVKEINERIEQIEKAIFLEEMIDLGYNFAKVRALNKELTSLKAMLNEREGE